jgi:hypothetical protein
MPEVDDDSKKSSALQRPESESPVPHEDSVATLTRMEREAASAVEKEKMAFQQHERAIQEEAATLARQAAERKRAVEEKKSLWDKAEEASKAQESVLLELTTKEREKAAIVTEKERVQAEAKAKLDAIMENEQRISADLESARKEEAEALQNSAVSAKRAAEEIQKETDEMVSSGVAAQHHEVQPSAMAERHGIGLLPDGHQELFHSKRSNGRHGLTMPLP